MSAAEAVIDDDSRSARGVPFDGADAMLQGWAIKANPYSPPSLKHLDWIAQWHTANALAFRAHVEGITVEAIPSRTAYGIICAEYQRAVKANHLRPGNLVQLFAVAVLNRIAALPVKVKSDE